MNYSTIKTTIAAFAADNQKVAQKADAAVAAFEAWKGALDGVQPKYEDFINALTTEADGSSDAAIVAAKSEADLLVDECQTTCSAVAAIRTVFVAHGLIEESE